MENSTNGERFKEDYIYFNYFWDILSYFSIFMENSTNGERFKEDYIYFN